MNTKAEAAETKTALRTAVGTRIAAADRFVVLVLSYGCIVIILRMICGDGVKKSKTFCKQRRECAKNCKFPKSYAILCALFVR